jgi:creatinine amidohydrolase
MSAIPPHKALPSRFWADLSTRDFARFVGDQTIAVLPVAAIEQHGPHLPVSVDQSLVDGVVQAAMPHLNADCPVLFLPTQAVGKSNEHLEFPGTLNVSAVTLIALWTDIGESVARAGVKKLILFNSHGGQLSVMDIVARELRVRHDMLVWSVNWWTLPLGDAVMGQFPAAEHRFGIHAGDMETSMMLHLVPDRVDMSQAQNFVSAAQARAQDFEILGNGSSAKLGWQTQDYNAFGACGNAAAATAAKGKAVVEAAGQKLAQLLHEVQRVPPTQINNTVQIP